MEKKDVNALRRFLNSHLSVAEINSQESYKNVE
jgi:hypothetical protein